MLLRSYYALLRILRNYYLYYLLLRLITGYYVIITKACTPITVGGLPPGFRSILTIFMLYFSLLSSVAF